jgi:hypothetical protein
MLVQRAILSGESPSSLKQDIKGITYSPSACLAHQGQQRKTKAFQTKARKQQEEKQEKHEEDAAGGVEGTGGEGEGGAANSRSKTSEGVVVGTGQQHRKRPRPPGGRGPRAKMAGAGTGGGGAGVAGCRCRSCSCKNAGGVRTCSAQRRQQAVLSQHQPPGMSHGSIGAITQDTRAPRATHTSD